jgi:hypothetical protein
MPVHTVPVSFCGQNCSAWGEETIALCDRQSVLLIERAGLTDSTDAQFWFDEAERARYSTL